MDGSEKKEVRRPMNAFLIFCKRHRGFVREKNPDMDNRSVTRVLGDLWANLGEEKKIYTNLAKQYKDAFMKANPNYKWHSAEKSQSSTGKLVNKPTNSRVIKNVPEIHTDGSIVPGKLADPDKMGGLSLLLMADKETHEGRHTCLSQSSKLQLGMPKPVTVSPMMSPPTNTSSSDRSAVSNSALLQLAEMCASELQDSRQEKPHPRLNTQSLAGIPSLTFSNSDNNYQSMPPPKKRVRHWSLTESDSSYDAPVDYSMRVSGYRDSSSPKIRCSSVGSSACSDDRYSSWENCKSTSSRRKLSLSATESIPSPSCPMPDGSDETDSPVFSPDITKSETKFSGELKDENNESFVHMQGHVTRYFDLSVKNYPVDSRATVCVSPTDFEESANMKFLKQASSVATSFLRHQPPGFLAAEVPRNITWKEFSESDHRSADSFLRGPLDSIPAGTSTEGYGERDLRTTSEKNSYPDFHIWREPGKVANKAEDLSRRSFSASSNLPTKPCLSPVLRLNSSVARQIENKIHQHGIGSHCGTASVAAVLTSSVDSRQASNDSLLTGRTISLSSGVGEGKNTSVLTIPDTQAPSLLLNFSSNTNSSYHPQSKTPQDSKEVFRTNDTELAFKINNTIPSSVKISSADVNRKGIIPMQTSNLKLIKSEDLQTPQTHHGQTFSEGKLKKKWVERMLIETKLKEEFPEKCKVDFLKTDPSVLGENCPGVHETYQNSSSLGSEPPFSKIDKYTTDVAEKHPQADGQSYDRAQLAFNQPNSTLETRTCDSYAASSSTNNHSKLMLHLSQNSQIFKSDSKPQTSFDETRLKFDLDTGDFTKALNKNPERLPQFDNIKMEANVAGAKSEDPSNKQVLNQIAACGKRFMDRIVEQLYKTDLSLGRQTIKTDISEICDTNISAKSERLFMEVKFDPRNKSVLAEKEMRDERKEKKLENVLATNSVKEKRKITAEDTYGKSDSCEQGSSSPEENHSQNHWLAIVPEAADQLEILDDSSLQPVRKSRRANRGQKYQELIKEGFIQPSRERLAARNAERHGRSFGSREEYEKMEVKRTLKRSASEKDTLSDCAAVSTGSHGAALNSFTDKRFTSGDFDLEKEIESLPVCSLEQLDKKKVARRRCDSDTLGSPPCHLNKCDTVTLSHAPSSTSQAKVSPAISSLGKHEVVSELVCPAPHIPLPREERPVEPVTGSRKRKARKHCITRISVVDQITSAADMVAQSLGGDQVQLKKICTPSSSGDSTGKNRNIPGLTRTLQSIQETAVIKSKDGKIYTLAEDHKSEATKSKDAPEIFSSHCLEFKDIAAEKMPGLSMDTPNLAGSNYSLTSYSSPRSSFSSKSFSLLSDLPDLKAAFLIPQTSNKLESEHELVASVTHKHTPTSQNGSRPPNKTVTIAPTLHPTETSVSVWKSVPSDIEVKGHFSVVPETKSVLKNIRTISSEDNPSVSEITSDVTCHIISKICTPKDTDFTKNLSLKTLSTPSSKKLPTVECLEKTKRSIGSKINFMISPTNEKLHATNKKVRMNLKRKLTKKNMTLVSENSNQSTSVLLGHFDPSHAIKPHESGNSNMSCFELCSENEKPSAFSGRSSPGAHEFADARTTETDFSSTNPSSKSSPSFLKKTLLFPLSIGKSPHLSKATAENTTTGSELPFVVTRSIISESALKTMTNMPAAEPLLPTDCVVSVDTTSKDISVRSLSKGLSVQPRSKDASVESITFKDQSVKTAISEYASVKTAVSEDESVKIITPKDESKDVSAKVTVSKDIFVSVETTELKDNVSLPHKPHSPISSSANSSPNEAAVTKSQEPLLMEAAFVSPTRSILQLSSHITTNNQPISDFSSVRTTTTLPCTCSTLHTPILNVLPSSLSSSSSLSPLTICTTSSTFVSAASSLLLPSPPLSSPSPPLSSPFPTSTVFSSPTVISLASATSSTKSDIVSYTVIGSSSIMEAGSPHMISSPHLPESPSVAIVQS